MYIFKKVKDLREYLNSTAMKGQTVGFVPTMGALHQGHISLIEKAKNETDKVVCSIFVNPTQFNDASDLNAYPRTIGQDLFLLEAAGNDIVFLPEVEEVYPKDKDNSLKLDFGVLDRVMEGEFRPGHFEGVAQVVHRLLTIVKPNAIYMGQKDIQQTCIVNSMLKATRIKTKLVVCPTYREEDGLAFSSRNVRLTKEFRDIAPVIHQSFQAVFKRMTSDSPKELEEWGFNQLKEAGLKPEYYQIVDGRTLLQISNFKSTDYAVVCTAAWAGDVRLIDNFILKQPH